MFFFLDLQNIFVNEDALINILVFNENLWLINNYLIQDEL